MSGERKQIIGTHQTDNVVLPIIKANEIEVKQPPIGCGSFGKVYKGKCRGKDVAVKVLDGIDWDESVLDEFIEEVAIMAQLLHPNILLCMGACTEENFGQNNYAIIMEFMPRGDLHHILHNPDIQLSLPKRLQTAIDICQGMAWLSGQGILHRDLKPANVLVDQHWRCKICDFGLSQIQRGKNKLRDEDEAPGSVLWMAPEVLLNEPIDSKLDVYSFALVFWEILTRKDLFTEYDDKDVFTEDIARKGVRPPMTEKDVHPILQKIIIRAWDRDPAKRPTFQDLIILFEQALHDIYLPTSLCPDAAKFWDRYWRGKAKVPFPDFIKQLYKYLEKRTINPVQTLCAEAILAEDEDNEKYITIERFSALLKWFGPLKVEKSTVLDRLEQVMKKDWFFGDTSSNQAEDKLQLVKDKPGTFLVRVNMGGATPIEKTPFTISRIDKSKKILHTRVYPREDGGFLIQVQKGKEQIKVRNKHNNIEEFITHIKKKEPSICAHSCPGWPYKDLFASAPREKSSYEEVQTDDV